MHFFVSSVIIKSDTMIGHFVCVCVFFSSLQIPVTQTHVIQMPYVPRHQELTPDLHAHAFHLSLEMVLFAEVSFALQSYTDNS